MMAHFDPDALLAALPRRAIKLPPPGTILRTMPLRAPPEGSALAEKGQYNGFSDRERFRTASLSNWLAKLGCTARPAQCGICQSPADDEHAEDYYDLTSWIGLCRRCHRTLLHGRFTRPTNWDALLDQHEIPEGHWSRLVSRTPFDIAALLRSRGKREPVKADFLAIDTR